jgi:DNA repair protein RecO (recombination protein O)
MSLISDQGIVLRRLDYSETSQVLVVLTREHGKVRAIAKGIKRSTRTRHAAAIDLLDVGDLVVSARTAGQQELAILTEWKQCRSLAGLRQSLSRLYAAQYAAEVTAGLTADWDPHPRLYEALLRLLGELCESDAALPALLSFVSELLVVLGSGPQLEVCVACRRVALNQPIHFSSFEGGLLCRDCEAAFVEKRQVPPGALAVLQGRRSGGPASYRAALELLNYHVSHLMGRAPLLADKVLPSRLNRRQSSTK